MKKTIQIRLTPESIQKAINELQAERNRIPVKLREIGNRLAQEGAAVARSIYGSSVSVSVEETSSGFKIVASGRPVAFFEFGAGIYTDPTHPLAGEAAKEGLYVYDGSYSEEHARQYVEWNYWYFGGMKIEGVQPRYALWSADQQMAANLAKVAREVFSK